MKVIENLVKAEFLGKSEDVANCDTGLPPGCDCICHTPCDFGKMGIQYDKKNLNYKSEVPEIYVID